MTTTHNPVTAPLVTIFNVNNVLITRALDGLREDELRRRPSDHSNSMFWLLGHIVHTRGGLLRLLGEDYRTGWGDVFRRGASELDRQEYPALSSIERVREDVIGRVRARLGSVEDDQLTKPAPTSPAPNIKTVRDLIAFLAMHEAYHVGQLGFIRKLMGHSAIAG
jgi:uncharacterized damage-inducible protein DinB